MGVDARLSGPNSHRTDLGGGNLGTKRKQQNKVLGSACLGDSQRWHHPMFLVGLAAKLVGHLEPNFHRVALSNINSVDEHLLLDPVLLLGCNVSARLRPKL